MLHYEVWQGAVPGPGSRFYWQTIADQCHSMWNAVATIIRTQEAQHAQAQPSQKLDMEMIADDVDIDMVD